MRIALLADTYPRTNRRVCFAEVVDSAAVEEDVGYGP